MDFKSYKYAILLLLTLLLTSCSSKGLVGDFGDYWDLLPDTIDSFSSFIKAWFILLIINLTCSILLAMILGLRGRLVTIILFFLVLFLKDYGFFTTIFLFLFSGFSGIILYIINLIFGLFMLAKEMIKSLRKRR